MDGKERNCKHEHSGKTVPHAVAWNFHPRLLDRQEDDWEWDRSILLMYLCSLVAWSVFLPVSVCLFDTARIKTARDQSHSITLLLLPE
mmetsp:Transcript_26077/g.51168  ORF Transcript_26077/g.51168 Transcript_26077/m.51168 type:complete len:88 (+) Transcript_26077:804-1067(+)